MFETIKVHLLETFKKIFIHSKLDLIFQLCSLAIVHLILLNSSVEGLWLDEEVARFRSYYTCYYNQYFQIKPEEGDNPKRKTFVDSLLEDALEKKDEVPPTDACVSWICDPSLVWRRTLERNLEIWAYFALEGRSIVSWGRCFEDQQEEFRRNNYTVHDVGVHAIIRLSDNRQRLFYVPSKECYSKGSALVSEVVAVLGNHPRLNADLVEKGANGENLNRSLDRVFATFCQDDLSPRGGNEVLSDSSLNVKLQSFCLSLGLSSTRCTWNSIVVFLYMLAILLLFNVLLLSCVFRKRISALLCRLCRLDTVVPMHNVKEGHQV